MSIPDDNAGSAKGGGSEQFHWLVCRASEEIRGEIVLTRLVEARRGPQTLHGSVALTIQLYEMPSGTRWIRFWDWDGEDKHLPYDDFAHALREAVKDLGWTEADSAPIQSS
jgi:hypothetical protein